MTLQDTIERISRKLESKGIAADTQTIEAKLNRYVNEFSVQLTEAERSVMNELARDSGIGNVTPGPYEKKKIGELRAGDWAMIEGRVVSLAGSNHPSIAQSGIIADETGAIKFIIWTKGQQQRLELDKYYSIESAIIDEYKGALSLKMHSGTSIVQVENDISYIPTFTQVSALKPGVHSVKVKLVQEWEVNHDRMLQTGLVADESGPLKFVLWKETGSEPLKPDIVYGIYYAIIDEYNERLSMNISGCLITPVNEDFTPLTSRDNTIEGVIVQVSTGSGLVKRCPVEGCKRVLSPQNYCPIHEYQPDFIYDLRIKGWLDDGIKAYDLLIKREGVEAFTGITLDAAKEMAETSPLGMNEVYYRVKEAMLGRYVTCTGFLIEGKMVTKHCHPLSIKTSEKALMLVELQEGTE